MQHATWNSTKPVALVTRRLLRRNTDFPDVAPVLSGVHGGAGPVSLTFDRGAPYVGVPGGPAWCNWQHGGFWSLCSWFESRRRSSTASAGTRPRHSGPHTPPAAGRAARPTPTCVVLSGPAVLFGCRAGGGRGNPTAVRRPPDPVERLSRGSAPRPDAYPSAMPKGLHT